MAISRKPRWRVKVGSDYAPAVACEVHTNNFQHADTFSAVIAFRAGTIPLSTWLTTMPPFEVTIEFGWEAKGGAITWQKMFGGLIDHVDVNGEEGQITIKGRDKTALFLDHKIAEAYQNKTASEIVQLLASQRGVQADIQSTSTLVGRYYSGDHTQVKHDQFSSSRTDWDFMCQLADDENFRVWVDSKTDILHFKPEEEFDGLPYPVTWTEPTTVKNASKGFTSTMMQPNLTHNLAASKDIKVAVKSFHSGKKASYTAYAGSKNSKAKTSQDVTIYTYKYPNLTLDQAQAKADAIYDDLCRHESVLSFENPGDPEMTPRRKVALSGIGEGVDRDFYADEVSHLYSENDGYTIKVRAKTIPPQAAAEGDDGFE